jgi:ATP-binding cassette subfamily C protein
MNWSYILDIIRQHKSTLVAANVIAILSALLSVPMPMLMPMMVDEVLLDKPGQIVPILEAVLPAPWQGPVIFLFTIMLVTMVLRFASLMLAVLQTRDFTLIAKDISYHIVHRRRAFRYRCGRCIAVDTLAAGAVYSADESGGNLFHHGHG